MKIAVLSDIHGNQYALKAVMAELDRIGVDSLLVLGDLVGYYYGIEEVLELLISNRKVTFIKGNHDQMLLDILDGVMDPTVIRDKYGSAHDLALRGLGNAEIEFFRNLLDHQMINEDGVSFSLNHGSPFDKDQYLYPDSELTILQKCDQKVDFVLIGHSHHAFVFKNENSLLVNVGSVGQSREHGGVASWCLVDTNTKAIQIKYSPYEIDGLLAEIRANDSEKSYLREVLLR